MQKLIFILVTGLLLTCTAMSFYFKQKRKPVVYESRITVTGNAKNISGHAAVVVPSTDIYYVDGLEQWEQDWLNREIKVTGDLINRDNRIAIQQETNVRGDNPEKVIKAAVVLLLNDETGSRY